jgi:adenine-specific DNA-methyltransferase
VARATDTAVSKLVDAVVAEAGSDPDKRRDVLQRRLTRLQISVDEQRAWRNGLDIVGSAYEALFSGEQRRDAGQFFTPFWAGELMAGWVFEAKANVCLDPGAGSGGLLIPAARHPKRRGAKLLGLDIDEVAVSMLDANARLRGMKNVEARQANFLLDDLPEQPQAIVCNPPYSRHHAVPAKQKLAIHDGFEKRLGVRFNGLAALHVLFLVRALEVAAPDARIAFITPSDWLDVGYGKKVKEWLLQGAQVDAILLLEESHLFFDGVLTTAAITLIRKTAPTGEPTNLIRLDGDPRRIKPKAIVDLLAGRVDLNGFVDEQPIALDPSSKWSRAQSKRRSGKTLGSVARVRRGIATGANGFFVLSEAERRKRDIPVSELKRCITSPRAFTGSELTAKAMDALPDDVPRWLVDCDDPVEATRDTLLGRYLRRGIRLGIHRGCLTAKRQPWHRQEQRESAPILFTYFNRDAPRFVRNRCGAVPLNNWLIIEPNKGVRADDLYKALGSKSVREQLDERRRVYGGGLWKLEPSELVEVRVTLPRPTSS